MARSIETILAEMRAKPSDVRFADACKVVTHYFGTPRQTGSSHRIWKMPWPGDPRVNMQQGAGGKAKAYQVRQAVAAIDALLAMRTSIRPGQGEPSRLTSPKKRPRR